MTRKEAIKILLNTAWLGTEQNDVETAVYMAVEALERESEEEMTPDHFDAEYVGGDRKSIEIEVRVNTDHVVDFAHEIRDAVIESVLQVIDRIDEGLISHTDELREAIEELRQ